MTYPPAGGTPDPYQPQQPYDPASPYSPQDPYAPPPSSGQPYGSPPPSSGQPYMFGDAAKGGQPYAPSYSGPPYQQYGMAGRTNGLAIASLVCSLLGFVTCLSAPVGIVLGHVAKKQIKQTGEQGEGMATAGLWVGYILTGLGLAFFILWMVLLAVGVWGASTSP